MRKRVYTINVNVKDGKELVDEIKEAARRSGSSVSAYLVRCHVVVQEKIAQELQTKEAAQ